MAVVLYGHQLVAERCLAGCHKAADIGLYSQLPVESNDCCAEGLGLRGRGQSVPGLNWVWCGSGVGQGWQGMAAGTLGRNALASVDDRHGGFAPYCFVVFAIA